ncbi:DUF3310 domain-containing protein [Campylobacter hyointestinalis]|uniref:DUF3310 domain-containing protein n=1 Tax=Campylobacter hyointestinalis TaxID=198 RepID=UPI000CE2EF73|nr:DUF3310 domain-containing protein [Campylobacter hyointestinalis]PPB51698.1 hypothetical protein CDQ69_08840 [Campylobacter hyointestinalis subsp. hyointestinalis]
MGSAEYACSPYSDLSSDGKWNKVNTKKEQVGGSHYKNKAIEPIDYIRANNLDFCEGDVVKYITRHKEKGGIEDLKKAKQYIDFILESYEENI